MSETILTALITSVTGVVTILISTIGQILIELMKRPEGDRTIRALLRRVNWPITAGGTVAAAAIMLVFLLATLPKVAEYSADVSTQCPAFSPSGVTLARGDDVEIIVQGDEPAWDCGRDLIGPAGFFGEKYPNHFLPSANACELIGYIDQPEIYFRVGYYKRFEAPSAGPLYLGINDAREQCKGNPAEPHLTVKIVVTK